MTAEIGREAKTLWDPVVGRSPARPLLISMATAILISSLAMDGDTLFFRNTAAPGGTPAFAA